MTNKSNVSEAQQDAHQRHDEKRKSAPRLPGTRISDDESDVMDDLYERFNSKAEAILEAAKYYIKRHK